MDSLPSLKKLLSLEAVVRLGGVSEAAEELCVSHSAISQNLKQLETELGMPLFHRRGRQLVAGANTRLLATEINQSVEDLRRSIKTYRLSGTSNQITLKMVSTLALRWFIPKLPSLQAALPALNVKLVTEPSSAISELPPEVDAAIGFARENDFDTQYYFLLRPSELVLVARTDIDDHPALADMLAGQNKILVANRHREQDWADWSKVNQVPLRDEEHFIRMENSAQALEAVSAGAGVLVTQRLFVEELIKLDHLKQLGKVVRRQDAGYYFYCRRENQRSQPVVALESWLRALVD